MLNFEFWSIVETVANIIILFILLRIFRVLIVTVIAVIRVCRHIGRHHEHRIVQQPDLTYTEFRIAAAERKLQIECIGMAALGLI